MNLIYSFGINGRLTIVEGAVEQMRAFVQHESKASEAGGVLLGRHLLDSGDLVIDEVTVPQKRDKRKRFSFFRSKSHNDVANQRWRESHGKSAYLGLWHTHPEAIPVPSQTDLSDWESASLLHTYDGDRLFFIIVGIEELRVWSKTRNGELKQLLFEKG